MLPSAINVGLGNPDCGLLPRAALDLRHGWLDYPRPKTEAKRRGKLWPETIAAIEEWLDVRPRGADSETNMLVFVTSKGNFWRKEEVDDRPITKEFAKALRRHKLNRYSRGFYDLRRTFTTIACDCGDERAASPIIGHVDDRSDMSFVYIQEVRDERLGRVAESVRAWLWLRPTAGDTK